MQNSTVSDCSIIEINKHHSERKGCISVVENGKTVPFDVKRIFYLYDIPCGESRGSHAHKENYQLIVSASGSFDVTLDDGKRKKTFSLNKPNKLLLVKPGIWCELTNFSSGSVCMVLTSEVYDEADYLRSYNDFLEYKKIEK